MAAPDQIFGVFYRYWTRENMKLVFVAGLKNYTTQFIGFSDLNKRDMISEFCRFESLQSPQEKARLTTYAAGLTHRKHPTSQGSAKAPSSGTDTSQDTVPPTQNNGWPSDSAQGTGVASVKETPTQRPVANTVSTSPSRKARSAPRTQESVSIALAEEFATIATNIMFRGNGIAAAEFPKIYPFVDDDGDQCWNVFFAGPPACTSITFQNGVDFLIEFPQSFPQSAPICTMIGGMIHPNFIAQDPIRSVSSLWRPEMRVRQLLEHLQNLLINPDFETPGLIVNEEAVYLYKNDRAAYDELLRNGNYFLGRAQLWKKRRDEYLRMAGP